ncbi:unnamed protein product, partial [Mesorhabditis belari]|uniref:Uncharacterized protein n=1 Tax=Mesorhabditis belari TaxID=2138241 RepID=A0AAF3J7U3_9BILA
MVNKEPKSHSKQIKDPPPPPALAKPSNADLPNEATPPPAAASTPPQATPPAVASSAAPQVKAENEVNAVPAVVKEKENALQWKAGCTPGDEKKDESGKGLKWLIWQIQ